VHADDAGVNRLDSGIMLAGLRIVSAFRDLQSWRCCELALNPSRPAAEVAPAGPHARLTAVTRPWKTKSLRNVAGDLAIETVMRQRAIVTGPSAVDTNAENLI
jgi:hypothetical protein